MAKKQFVGTSLRVLQRYLNTPGVRVHQNGKIPSVVAYTLLSGLLPGELFPVVTTHYSIGGAKLGTDYSTAENVRLVLKPFAALVKPLSDGTIPVIEAWKLHSQFKQEPITATMMDNGAIKIDYAQGCNFLPVDFLQSPRMGRECAEYLAGLGFPVGLAAGEYEEVVMVAKREGVAE